MNTNPGTSLNLFSVLVLLVILAIGHSGFAQIQQLVNSPYGKDDRSSASKLEGPRAALQLSNTYVDWALMVFGGSLLILLGTSYRRPEARWARHFFWLFPVGWIFLAWSIHCGSLVQRAFTALAISRNASNDFLLQQITAISVAIGDQILLLQLGLAVFAVWQLSFLVWWIFHKEAAVDSKKQEKQQ